MEIIYRRSDLSFGKLLSCICVVRVVLAFSQNFFKVSNNLSDTCTNNNVGRNIYKFLRKKNEEYNNIE